MIYTFSPYIRHLFALLIIFSLSFQACSPQDEPATEQEQENAQTSEDTEEPVEDRSEMPASEDDEEQADITLDRSDAPEKNNDTMYDASGAFTVQLGAFRNEYMAENEVGTWESKGFDRIFMQQEGNMDTGDIWYRVYAGRYASYQDAKEMAARIEREQNEKAWARRLP